MDHFAIVPILLVLVGLATFLLRPGGLRRLAFGRWDSQYWPWAKTSIGNGLVDAISEGERGGSMYKLTVPYSYSVNGKEYAGEYTEGFATESEAQDLLKSLQELPSPARYKPADPSVSVMDPYRDVALGVIRGATF
jgi:hypothetical protein